MTASDAAQTGVLDANGIIGLAKAGCFQLIPRVFSRVVAPLLVVRQITDPISRGALDIASKSWLTGRAPHSQSLLRIPMLRSEADRHVLALALDHHPSVIVTGDRALMKRARQLQLATVSAPRVVQLLAEARLIHAAKPHLDQMLRSGFGIAPELYDEILRALGEA